MLPPLKYIFINYILMLFVIFGIVLVQSTFWPFVFSYYIPLYLWLPFLVYWALYRGPWETVFIIYFLSLNLAATSSISPSHFLLAHSLFVLILIAFKKFYYTSQMFFNMACLLGFVFIPISLWILSIIKEGHSFFPAIIPWILGTIVSWLLAWPLLYLLKWLDNSTISQPQDMI